MTTIFPWVLTILGVAGFWMAGKKVWWAWYVNLLNQFMWISYSFITQQWGFLAGAGFYTVIFLKNAVEWTREWQRSNSPSELFLGRVRRVDPATTPMRYLRSRGRCNGCGAAPTEWCKDRCRYMDPYDYR